jgi:hypothetical protein
MADSFVASDYAGITGKHMSVYYGYEETTKDGEWCFVARVGETEIMRIPQSRLKAEDKFDCASCLMAGVGQLFDKYGVK